MAEQTCGLSTFSWHCWCPRFPPPQQHLHPWHSPSSWRDALLCQGRAPAAKAQSWGQVRAPAGVAAHSQRLQGYKHTPFNLREHCMYTLHTCFRAASPTQSDAQPGPSFLGPLLSGQTHTHPPGDTPAPAKHPRCQ